MPEKTKKANESVMNVFESSKARENTTPTPCDRELIKRQYMLPILAQQKLQFWNINANESPTNGLHTL